MGNNKHLSMKFVFSSLCIFLALSCITPGTSGATECASGVLTFTNLANAEAYNANTKKMYELGFAKAIPGGSTEEDGMFKFAAGITVCSEAASRRGLGVKFTACKNSDTFKGADPTGAPSMDETATAINAVIAKNGNGLGVANVQGSQITPSEADNQEKVCAGAGADAGAGKDAGKDAGAGKDDGAGKDAGAGAGAGDGKANNTNGTSSASCTGQFSLIASSIPVVAMVISKM